MIHEINEIIKTLSPDQIVNTIKTINPDDVLLRISSNYNQVESFVMNYPTIKHKVLRFGRISKVRYHNRKKIIKNLIGKK